MLHDLNCHSLKEGCLPANPWWLHDMQLNLKYELENKTMACALFVSCLVSFAVGGPVLWQDRPSSYVETTCQRSLPTVS